MRSVTLLGDVRETFISAGESRWGGGRNGTESWGWEGAEASQTPAVGRKARIRPCRSRVCSCGDFIRDQAQCRGRHPVSAGKKSACAAFRLAGHNGRGFWVPVTRTGRQYVAGCMHSFPKNIVIRIQTRSLPFGPLRLFHHSIRSCLLCYPHPIHTIDSLVDQNLSFEYIQ